MYLLDTNVLSELRRKKKADRRVLAWSESVDSADLYISAVTLFEVQAGALRLKRRDIKQGDMLLTWIAQTVLPTFASRILPYDAEAALLCAKMHVPDPKPDRDSMIAATALTNDMIVVTRDMRDFAGMGVTLLDPWAHRDAQ